jgi:large subunit ribosomal protein L25
LEEVTLTADPGRTTGSAAARRLRSAGKVPAVLYGHGVEPLALAVEARALRAAIGHEAGLNALLALDVGGQSHLAMARQVQRHPVRGTVDHVDFVIVRRDEIVAADVPVRLVGEAEEVHRADGLVEQVLFALTVHARPADIPNAVEVDISGLSIGEAVRVGEITLPDGVTTEVDPEEPLVMAQASKVAADVEAAETEAAAPAAEAAAAEAAGAEGAREGGGEDRGGEG